jgi:hypothetical protein
VLTETSILAYTINASSNFIGAMFSDHDISVTTYLFVFEPNPSARLLGHSLRNIFHQGRCWLGSFLKLPPNVGIRQYLSRSILHDLVKTFQALASTFSNPAS